MKNSFSTKNFTKNKNSKNLYSPFRTHNKKYKIIREYLPNLNPNSLNYNNIKDDKIQKELNILDEIWDELEITYQYRQAFSSYLKNMNEECKNNIIVQEKNNLKKYKKTLINLKKEISLREENILSLKRFNNRIENFNNTNNQMTNVIESVINIVKKLRKNAINIVKEYTKIQNISKNYSNLEKINKKIIKQEYDYDPNYIYKMQDDLLFLKESSFCNYFEMDNKYIDPFLTNFCAQNLNQSNKNTISNNNDIIGLINESRYDLFQKKIFDKINMKNKIIEDDLANLEKLNFNSFVKSINSKNNKKIEFKTKNDENKEKKMEQFLTKLKNNEPDKYSSLFLIKKNILYDNYNNLSNPTHKIKKPILLIRSDSKSTTNILNTQKLREENIELRKKLTELNEKIIIEYYKDDINKLMKLLETKMKLDKIPLILKNSQKLGNYIYNKELYIKGIYPKILILKKEKNNDKNDIIALCSFYYEWNDDPKSLILRLNALLCNDEKYYEKYIMKMVDFIKYNIKYDKIKIDFINDESGKQLSNYFQKNLKFKFSSIKKNKNDSYQLKSLYYQKPELKNISDNFILTNKSNIVFDKIKKIKSENNENKDDFFININNIYYILNSNKNIDIEYNENNKKIDTKKNSEEKKLENNEYNFNININFDNYYSLLINDIYYNKIQNNDMKIYKEEKTNSIFYLIPVNEPNITLNICELNPELKKILINDDDKKNIYEKFLDFNTNSKIELIETNDKNLYIPAFKLNKKYNLNNFEEIEKNIKIIDNKTKEPLYLSELNEFINVEFIPDINIKNNFFDDDNKKNLNAFIIKNDFIISIFSNDIVNDNKLNLIQVLYVTKDDFLNKINYKE